MILDKSYSYNRLPIGNSRASNRKPIYDIPIIIKERVLESMAHNHNRTDAVSVWKGEATAVDGDCGGNRNGNIRVAFCKKCDTKTKVKVFKTAKTNARGQPIIRNECLTCGNAWAFADRNVTTIGDMLKVQMGKHGLNSKSKAIIKYAERQGLFGGNIPTIVGQHPDIIRSQGEMIATDRHPHFDDKKTFTIKCVKCGREMATSCFVKAFGCPDCNGRHYSYLMLNGEYL